MDYQIKIEIMPGLWWCVAETNDRVQAEEWHKKYLSEGHNAMLVPSPTN